ncbi:MAG TPA: LysM peptidoglycan-binding domain-containing protein [Hanamia sp.]|nr:LysM peptidoglycan-binding domain-containing protein [Hanamia sp.]
MAKWLITILITIITSNFLFAQQAPFEIKGTGSNLYIEHKVAPKESLYSLGRLYNVSPKELAAYNHLQMESGLNVGQDLKVPLEKNNFTQTQTAKSNEVLIPVHHTVAPQETLYRLGVNYNKVPLASLKKWNHLPTDAVSVGSQMIVGFLKVDKNQSSLASQGAIGASEMASVSNKEEKPVEKKPEVIGAKTPEVKASEPVNKQNKEVNTGKTEESKVAVATVNKKGSINFSGGFFKGLYDQQTEKKSPVNANGSAGVFKSTSGWQDGKYYCFNNEAAPGTILKVTDNATGKSVYAKVLDAIPDIKQNEGLALVLSNAAAEELGSGESTFECALSFVK